MGIRAAASATGARSARAAWRCRPARIETVSRDFVGTSVDTDAGPATLTRCRYCSRTEFANRVHVWLVNDVDGVRADALADHFEVMRTWPRRLAKGTAVPYPRLREQIIRYIEEHS